MTLRADLIETLEAENDQLRERVRQLEQMLGFHVEAPLQIGLTQHEASVFGFLLTRELASKEQILTAVYSAYGRDEPEMKIVNVFICKIRKKLKPYGVNIETLWGRGYYIPSAMKARVHELWPSTFAETSVPEVAQ